MAEPIRWQDAWWYQQPDGTWMRFNDATEQWEAIPTPPQAAAAPAAGMSTGAKVAIGLTIALVTFLILAILAAIAIPVFLRQREKGWTSQVEAALKNAATAQESYCVDSDECYTTSVDDLYAEGLNLPEGVQLRVARADDDSYCLEARHMQLPNEIWSYDSTTATPRAGPCIG